MSTPPNWIAEMAAGASHSTELAIFADLTTGIWGMLMTGARPHLALSRIEAQPGTGSSQAAEVTRDDDGILSVAAPAGELRLQPAQAATVTPDAPISIQPVRITGIAALDDGRFELDVPGVLAETTLDGRADSLRLFGAWFPAGDRLPDGYQVGLVSKRPVGAKGHDRDVVSLVSIRDSGALAFDSRLSATYGTGGVPRRAGIETWVGDGPDGDQFPVRVAGIVTGMSAGHVDDGRLSVSAHALHCVSRGVPGAGVYAVIAGV